MTRKPNIVLILADDLGYGDLGCYGARPEHVQTPNIDSLAQEGTRFTDAHSPSSVCTPSRYNLLTGRYCWRTWAQTGCVWANDPCLIEDDRPTLASVLRDGGYETGMVGKWHLGFGSPNDPDWDPLRGPNFNAPLTHGPRSCGFDSFFGIPAVGQLPHFYIHDDMVCDLESGDPVRIVPDPHPEFFTEYLRRSRVSNPRLRVQGGASTKYLSEDLAIELTQKAVEFIERDHDRPFFLYFAHRNVHGPLDPHPRFKGSSPIGEYGDFIHELDWSVGEVLAALDRKQLTNDTLVIFSSDNGATENHRPTLFVNYNGHLANGILRGQKTELYEGGHRVPFIARWPARIAAGRTCSHLIALTDMLATCADLADVEVPNGASPDGVSCESSLLRGDAAESARRTLVHDSMMAAMYAVRHDEWKFILGQGGGGMGGQSEPFDFYGPPGQLFNLREDPAEQRNLYAHRPDVVNELVDLFLEIRSNEAVRTPSTK
jgi:arylsulfatase A